MCGIIGFLGNICGNKMIFEGIKILLNRGYDSVGVCGLKNNNFLIDKYASTIEKNSYDILLEHQHKYENLFSPLISHSRWATHGPKTDINAHPHVDYSNRFAIVHNGIIENYSELKKELIDKYNVTFKSQTDTEIIVNLISVLYDQYNSIEVAMEHAFDKLEGTWGVLLMSTLTPNKLYCARHGSPLLIGMNDDFYMVASEQSGFAQYVKNYICLNNKDIVTLENLDGKVKMNTLSNYVLRDVNKDFSASTPFPYPHWTLKEIMEQPESINRALGLGSRIMDDYNVKLGGLDSKKDKLLNIQNIIFLGCGTSYHAGLVATYFFKELCDFNTVTIHDGAEFTYKDIPKYGNSAAILVSQSGETNDLHRCIKICNQYDVLTIGVVNVVDSLIARETDCGVYLNAGKEFAVASTKAFTSQVVILALIAIWFAQHKNLNTSIRKDLISGLRRLNLDVTNSIEFNKAKAKIIAEYLKTQNSMFILGKNICEPAAKEGSLKIKEIGYIHAEAYSSSALKHGPFAIIEPGLPIFMILPDDDFYAKNTSASEEVKSRHAKVIGISDRNLNNNIFDMVFEIPKNYYFRQLLSVIPLQLVAYELACLKGNNPDMPKNLAKVCTTS
jgi:glucosamine--fructose-6-phosphate aminotransferase (isomerizing)